MALKNGNISIEMHQKIPKNECTEIDMSSGEYNTKLSISHLQTSDSSSLKELHDFVLPKDQITFSWNNINAFGHATPLSRTVDSKQILKDVNGIAHPGELLIIMGSSGAGKTTLLNCMTFRNLKKMTISGLICLNKKPATQAELSARSGYVQQDDLFISHLTPKEHLFFQALLKMNAKFSKREKMEKVAQVLRELSLEKCENCLIGLPGVIKGISGGERKRLAFASELLINPALLFCDEPTTGLDSFMAFNVVQILKDIARSGRTVILTLHQPSSEIYQLFDKIYLMTEGRTAFYGTTEEAEDFFTKLQAPCPKNFNPADHFIQLLSIVPGSEEACKKTVRSICNAYENSSAGIKLRKESEKIINSVKVHEDQWSNNGFRDCLYRVNWWNQLQALFWRVWLATWRNPTQTSRRAVVVLLEALTISLIYNGQQLDQFGIQNISGIYYYLLVSTTFQNVLSVIDSFCGELPVFIKEHKDGLYRVDVYYIAKIICDIPVGVFLCCMNTSIVYYFGGLNSEWQRFLMANLITVLLCLSAQGIGYVVSTMSPNVQIAPYLITFLVTPFLMFAGVFMNLASIPSWITWLSDLSWFKYANEAYLINQWSDISHIKCGKNNSAASVCVDSGLGVLIKNRVTLSEFWPAMGALVILMIFFRFVAFIILFLRASLKD